MSRPDALIGHTGFVGSNLDRDWDFGARFNSRNIGNIRGQSFGTVVCAGVSAVKWFANKEPEKDWAGIKSLITHLDTIQCERFVLVSSVDVYAEPVGVTEADVPDAALAQPYGKHRRMLERWVEARFPRHAVARLPGLFGPGLKKNIIFDMMTGNLCNKISPNGVFQWYPLRRLAADLRRMIENDVTILNIAVEPISTGRIRDSFFPAVQIGGVDMPAALYDMRTNHAALLGGSGAYHLASETVLSEMAAFVQAERL